MNERKEYLKRQNTSGFSVGDEVKVIMVPVDSYQDGWAYTINDAMKIGQTGTVTKIDKHGIRVKIPAIATYDGALYFPYWALEKMEKTPIIYRRRIKTGVVEKMTTNKGNEFMLETLEVLNVFPIPSFSTAVFEYFVNKELN